MIISTLSWRKHCVEHLPELTVGDVVSRADVAPQSQKGDATN